MSFFIINDIRLNLPMGWVPFQMLYLGHFSNVRCTQEIATLMVSYAQLSDEERASAEGKALQRHIEDLTEQAGILRDAMADTTAAINNAAWTREDSTRWPEPCSL